MNLHPMKLVTIICESLASEPLKRLLADVGANGYTLFNVEGTGAQGPRVADIAEFGNIQIEVVVRPLVADELLQRLYGDFFPKFGMIAYVSEIQVLRPNKF